MRLGNPSMRKIFNKAHTGELAVHTEAATYGGIVKKSLLYGALTIVAAVAVAIAMNLAIAHEDETLLTVVLAGAALSALPMLIVSLIITFAPSTVKVLGCVYSLLQGALLGVFTYLIDAFAPGVALAAILGTLIVFVVCVALNKLLSVRISNGLFRGMFIAFISLLGVELIMYLLSMFLPDFFGGLFTAYLWLQLGISAFSVVYATILLLWDLQTADDIVAVGADKRYEWNVAFSLVTTIVYLYIEILELIVRLMLIFGRSRN